MKRRCIGTLATMFISSGLIGQLNGPAYTTVAGTNVGVGSGPYGASKLYVLANPPTNGAANIGTYSEAGSAVNNGSLIGLYGRAFMTTTGVCANGTSGYFDLYRSGSASFTNGTGVFAGIPSGTVTANGTGFQTQVLSGGTRVTGFDAYVSSNAPNKYGIRTSVNGTGGTNGHWGAELWAQGGTTNFGAWCEVSTSGTTGYGVYGKAAGMTGFQAGVYGLATANGTMNPQNGTWSNNTSWAVYSNGPQFSSTNALWGTSDARLKKDIQPLTGSLERILRLAPKSYVYDGSLHAGFELPIGRQLGFLSQEVEKVLPEVVMDTHVPDQFDREGNPLGRAFELKAMNSLGLIPVIVGALQEQHSIVAEQQAELDEKQAQIDAQQVEINALNDRLSRVEALLNGDQKRGPLSPALNKPELFQNTPNPFNENTVIRYSLPQAGGLYVIEVRDMNGRVVSVFNKLGSGQGQLMIPAGTLSTGTYTYTLIVDGEPVDTKTMAVTR